MESSRSARYCGLPHLAIGVMLCGRGNPALRCARAKRDDILMLKTERVWQASRQVYGADKVWRQLNREGQVNQWFVQGRIDPPPVTPTYRLHSAG
jgi:hypothetical protein